MQGADGLFGLAALQMHKADVAPRHGELGAAIGRFLIVAQAAFEIAALQTDAAKLHVGFGKMGRIADRGEKRFFRRHKVALAEQGYAKIVMVIGATVVLAERGPQVGDVLVKILVPVLHRSVPLSSGVYNTIRRTRRCRGSVRLCSQSRARNRERLC